MPARTASPPTPNSRPSCRPAVPPPPVSGAAVGMAGAAGADVCVARGVDGRADVGVTVADAEAEAYGELATDRELVTWGELATDRELVTWGELVTCGELATGGELAVCAELGTDAPGRLGAEACGELLGDRVPWPPVGDGVRVPACVSDDGGVCTGGRTVGDGVGPPVQAETAITIRTAPAAERPAVSHAPWASPGGVSRTFMNPPRMRVR